jgi:ABC-2 type transport system permease protein
MMVRYYLELYGTYFRMALRTLAQYRADFGIMAVSATVREGATIVFLSVIFGKISALQGWSFYEIVLAYGLGAVALSFGAVFLNMPHVVGWFVQRGQLDVILIRPAPALFQMLGQTCFTPHAAGSLVVGIAIVGVALARLDAAFQAWWLLYLPLIVISAALIAFSILLLIACLTFTFVEVASLNILLGYFPEYARYPLSIYSRPLQFALTWVLPYAMGGILPVGFLLGKEGYRLYGLLAPLMGWLFLGLALAVWRVAVRHYKSTGN